MYLSVAHLKVCSVLDGFALLFELLPKDVYDVFFCLTETWLHSGIILKSAMLLELQYQCPYG